MQPDRSARQRTEQLIACEPRLAGYRRQLISDGASDRQIARLLGHELDRLAAHDLLCARREQRLLGAGYVIDEPTAESEDIELLVLEAHLRAHPQPHSA